MVRQVTIVYSDRFIESTDDLIRILYIKNYFGFLEDAENYVDRIYDFIRDNITTYPARISPADLQKYGEKYLLYIPNTNTTWYIFYRLKDSVYCGIYHQQPHRFDCKTQHLKNQNYISECTHSGFE